MAKRKTNKDGMRYPSVDDLLEVVDSKYKLAYISAKRAKIIEEEKGYTAEGVEILCEKPVGQALEEVLDHKVEATFKPADTIFTEALKEEDNKNE